MIAAPAEAVLIAIGMPRRPRARRLAPRAPRGFVASVFLLVALFASQLAQLGHFVFIQHELCEHGDIVHVGREEARASDVTRDVSRSGEDAARSGSAAHGDEHEHCDGNAVRCQVGAPSAFSADAILLSFLLEPIAPERAEVRAVDALYLAPKSSPPIA